jgi:hypothetical protein
LWWAGATVDHRHARPKAEAATAHTNPLGVVTPRRDALPVPFENRTLMADGASLAASRLAPTNHISLTSTTTVKAA